MAGDIREVFDHVEAVMETSEARLYEQVDANFRWLLGTLFTANGGALVALTTRETPATLEVLGLFAGGVVCSILMGFANVVYSSKAIMPTTDIRMTIASMRAGEATIEQLQTKMANLDGITWLKWPIYGAGTLSLIFLIWGMLSYADII